MSSIKETRVDEGPELAPKRSSDVDVESGPAHEKKNGDAMLETYREDGSNSRVGSVHNEGEDDGERRWEWSVGYIYRRYRIVFHAVAWLLMTA